MSERTLVNELDKLVEDSNIYNKGQAKTQKELNEENEVLRNCIESELEDVTVEGTEISIDDAAKYSRNKLALFGNTEQASYDGRNVLKYDDTLPASITKKGLTVSIDKNGIVTVNGTATGQEFFGLVNGGSGLAGGVASDATKNNLQIDSNSTYTLSCNKIEGTCPNGWHISSRMVDIGWKEPSVDGSTTFSGTSGVNQIYIGVSGNYTFDNFKFTLQLEKGSTATEYEPYVGGVASPNPDYPQDIHVVSGENIIEVQGKNLLPANQIRTDKDWLIVNDDGSVTINYPSGNALNQINLFSTPINIPESTYRMKIFVEGTFRGGNLILQDINGNWGNQRGITDGQLFSISSLKNMQIWEIYAGTNCTIKFELEEGTTVPTEYHPYYHANYPINLGSIELCKIGNYQDYLYKENGNWYKYEAIRHNVATGASSEQWQWSVRNENKIMIQSQKIGACIDGRRFVAIFSNNFKGTTGDNVFSTGNNHTNIIGCAESNRIRIAVSPNDFANIDDFKNFLQENNLDFYFVLATPIITQITDETLIAQLDEIYEHLKLVKGTNNIAVTAEDLAPYIELTYKRSNAIKFQKEIDELKAMVIENS